MNIAPFSFGFKLALISKGLRHQAPNKRIQILRFQACPDFKGIKTLHKGDIAELVYGFQACPDFKGIKTFSGHLESTLFSCFKLALISKGLRLLKLARFAVGVKFQACPDFKGIKTQADGKCRDFDGGFKLALISKGLRPDGPATS